MHDAVGVGFGPSNLALAVAFEEHNETAPGGGTLTPVFLERQAAFGWHRNMLMEDATMQVSHLKDLATLRNPASRYTFVSYLHSRNRLIDFINHKVHYPSRVEFHDYLEWAAAKLAPVVRYGHEVVEIRPVTVDGEITELDVVARPADGRTVTLRTRNVVVAAGLAPLLPPGIAASDRVWHNSQLLDRLRRLPGAAPRRFVVAGAGQSAAECVEYLHSRYPDAEVCAVFSRYGYSPADDSPYANRIFDPAAVDVYFDAPQHVKDQLMAYHRNTNYSVVDLDLIQELYRRAYQEQVRGEHRLRLFNTTRLTAVTEPGDGGPVTAELHNQATGETIRLTADAVVCATGYQPADLGALLGKVDAYCERDPDGRLRLHRDYRIVTEPTLRAGIYLQGGTEHSHGITSSLLSNSAVRAGEIVGSIAAHSRPVAGSRGA